MVPREVAKGEGCGVVDRRRESQCGEAVTDHEGGERQPASPLPAHPDLVERRVPGTDGEDGESSGPPRGGGGRGRGGRGRGGRGDNIFKRGVDEFSPLENDCQPAAGTHVHQHRSPKYSPHEGLVLPR